MWGREKENEERAMKDRTEKTAKVAAMSLRGLETNRRGVRRGELKVGVEEPERESSSMSGLMELSSSPLAIVLRLK